MRNSFFALALVVVAFPTGAAAVPELNPELQALAAEFFQWRRVQQPATLDDVNRVERPDGWVPDFSPQAVKQYRADIRLFQKSPAPSRPSMASIVFVTGFVGWRRRKSVKRET